MGKISRGTARVLLAAALLGISAPALAITVTPGFDASLGADDFAVRFRSFQPTGADEVYLGVPDLGVAGNRVAQQINWAAGPTTFDFSFTYNLVTDQLTVQVAGNAPLTYTFAPDLVITAIQLTVADRDTTGELWLTNLVVNGEAAGDFGVGVDGFFDWMLTDIAAGPGLTVTGTINRTGTFSSSQELSRIEIKAGGALVPEPTALALLGLGLIGVGLRRRTA